LKSAKANLIFMWFCDNFVVVVIVAVVVVVVVAVVN
jgi:hypothetical protein